MTLMFRVDGSSANSLERIPLAKAGFSERAHLQEWILANPSVLGDDVLMIASEYDRWTGSDGVKARDRLDILGLDTAGRLVVVELKRDAAPSDVHLQAITYAALVSRFTLDTLAQAHADWLTRRGTQTSIEAAREAIIVHVGELDVELLRRPRIVLVAGSFPRQVTHTVVWLSEMGVIVELIETSAWQTENGPLVGFSRLWPTPELEDFTLRPAQEETAQVNQKAQQRRRAAAAVERLVDAGSIEAGTPLRFLPPTWLSTAQRARVEEWLSEIPVRGQAEWRNDAKSPLVWKNDGSSWLPTTLARHILSSATGAAREALRGPLWWVRDDGRSLADLADAVPGQGRRDWSDLHTILGAIPAGRWTTYGDIAQVIGTAAQPLGQHLTKCAECSNPWRVLNASGRVADGFVWSGPERSDPPAKILSDEGVSFTDGLADPTAEMTSPARKIGGSEPAHTLA